MTIAVTDIGHNSNAAGATLTLTGLTVPVGALIVAATDEKSNTLPGGSIADGSANSYVLTGQLGNNNSSSANGFGQWWYVKNSVALSSATLTYTKRLSGSAAALIAFYATGIDTVAPLDTSFGANITGSSGTPSITSTSTTITGELVVGILTWTAATTDTFTQDSTNAAYAAPPDVDVATTNAGIAGGYFVNSGSGTQTYAPTITSHPWAIFIAAFKPDQKSVPYQPYFQQLLAQ